MAPIRPYPARCNDWMSCCGGILSVAKTEILKHLEGDLEIVPRPSVTGERHGLIRFRGHPTKGGYDDDPGPGKRVRRARRHFTDQLGAGAIRLVLDEGKTATRVARGLDGLGGPLAAR